MLPALDVDAFMFMGRIDRPRRPSIWLYKHVITRGYLNVDADGGFYRFRPPRDVYNPRSNGSYVVEPSFRRALRAAGLHMLGPTGQSLIDFYREPDVPSEPPSSPSHLRLVKA